MAPISTPAVLPIELQPSNLRPIAYRILSKKHGLNIKSSALQKLAEFMGRKFGVEWRGVKAQQFLEDVAKLWKEEDRGLFLEGDELDLIIREAAEKQRANSGRQEAQQMRLGGGTVKSSSSEKGNVAEIGKNGSDVAESGDISTGTSSATGLASGSATKSVSASASALNFSDYFRFISAFSQRQITYNHTRHSFEYTPRDAATSIPPPRDLLGIYFNRYHILYDRLLRNDSLQPRSGPRHHRKHPVTAIKNLLGRAGQHFVIFGLLGKSPAGRWTLQDDSGIVEVDLSEVIAAPGAYYVAGNFLLCEGVFRSSGKFIAAFVDHPPAEPRHKSLEAFGHMDFLGVHRSNSVSTNNFLPVRIDKDVYNELVAQEAAYPNHRLVVLGCDVFLDDLRTFDALRKVFSRLETYPEPPIAIILLGSFRSVPFRPGGCGGSADSIEYKEGFNAFAELLSEFPKLASETKFVFIPGENDPWGSAAGGTAVWPLRPVPSAFGSALRRTARDCQWVSNPCRMVYLSQEVAFVRGEYGAEFRRASVVECREAGGAVDGNGLGIPDSGSQDLLGLGTEIRDDGVDAKTREARKGHLNPFGLETRPEVWGLSQSMSLIPLPTMVIIGDTSTPAFDVTYEGCRVVNAGRFMRNSQVCWVEYSCGNRTAEFKDAII